MPTPIITSADVITAAEGYFNKHHSAFAPQSSIASPAGLSPADANFAQTLIINQIYSLIASLISTTQEITAAQAGNLNVLTQWQNAYTSSLSQIKTFTQGDGTGAGGGNNGDTNWANLRSNLADINTNLRDNVQQFQSVASDSAKAMQSNINQSNSAVSSQVDMATSLIQELSTLLSAMYN